MGEVHADFGSAVARAARAREQQLADCASAHGADDQLVAAPPIDPAEMQRPHLVEAMVVADVPRSTTWRFQRGCRGVHEQDRRSDRRHAVSRKPGVHRVLELVEDPRDRWRALVKQSEPAAEDSAARAVQEHRRTGTRRDVESIDDAVAIEPAAELQVPARARLIAILGEQGDVRAADRLRGRHPGKVETAGERAVCALDEHRTAQARPVVLTAQHVQPDLEHVQPARALERTRQRFDHLIHARIAALSIEEIAERGLRLQLHRRRALRQHIRSVCLHLHGRFAEKPVGPERPLRHARLRRVRMKVDGRIGRREGAEGRVVRRVWKDTTCGDEEVAR